MKFWLDTEFYENGRTIELISIGIVSEDGREYYAEHECSDIIALKSAWLIKNVLPYLNTSKQTYLDDIRESIIEFVGNKPEFWGYYCAYDWVLLCQLYGSMIKLPDSWPMICYDVKQLCKSLGNPKLPDQHTVEHNALADAKWTKLAYEFLTNPYSD